MENDFGDFSPIFVFVAYAAVWIVFFAYLYYVARRQSDIRSQIDALKESEREDEDSAESNG
ncbi:MAG: CcmD family protein [Dehalococcoidia bacterium]|nr:CcmD family protein [Dehalococcoidia bacterium]